MILPSEFMNCIGYSIEILFLFPEPRFTGDTNLTLSPDGIDVTCSVYDLCLQAMIELRCLDSSGSLVYEYFLSSRTSCSHTIPKIFLSECETYTVILVIAQLMTDTEILTQSEILFNAVGERRMHRRCYSAQ